MHIYNHVRTYPCISQMIFHLQGGHGAAGRGPGADQPRHQGPERRLFVGAAAVGELLLPVRLQAECAGGRRQSDHQDCVRAARVSIVHGECCVRAEWSDQAGRFFEWRWHSPQSGAR